MWICQKCNTQNTSKFCMDCGTSVNEQTADELPPTVIGFQPLNQFQAQNQPNFAPQFQPPPAHSFRVPQAADGNLESKSQSGVLPTVLGIAAMLLSLGGLFTMIIVANYYKNDSLYLLLLFVCGAVGLALAATACVFGNRVRKGRVVAVLGILASLFPLGIFAFSVGGAYADKNGYFDSFKEDSSISDSPTYSTSDNGGNTASNTPRDALIAFTDACQREHYAAVKEQMSNSLLEGLEKIAKQKNIASHKLIQDSFIQPIKADMDNGGKVQTRNEIITGNTATVENTISGRKWDKTKFIIEDGRWKITNN